MRTNFSAVRSVALIFIPQLCRWTVIGNLSLRGRWRGLAAGLVFRQKKTDLLRDLSSQHDDDMTRQQTSCGRNPGGEAGCSQKGYSTIWPTLYSGVLDLTQ